VQIDLKDPNALSLENVRKLLASKDDSRHRQLRVTSDGIAFISDDIGNLNLDGILFRFETWFAGNGYCGPEAAADDAYVREIYEDLKTNWPNPKDSYIDY
jgi:hypothetical protein